MRRTRILALCLLPLLYATALAAEWRNRPDWTRYFTDAGTPGTFVLYDLQHDRYQVSDRQRDDNTYFFALNMSITSKEHLGARFAITKAILRAEGILPPNS